MIALATLETDLNGWTTDGAKVPQWLYFFRPKAISAMAKATEGQKSLHDKTVRTYNQLIQAQRLRLDAVQVPAFGCSLVDRYCGSSYHSKLVLVF